MEIVIIALVVLGAIVLVAYLIMQNLKDKNNFEEQINMDLRPKDKESPLDKQD